MIDHRCRLPSANALRQPSTLKTSSRSAPNTPKKITSPPKRLAYLLEPNIPVLASRTMPEIRWSALRGIMSLAEMGSRPQHVSDEFWVDDMAVRSSRGGAAA